MAAACKVRFGEMIGEGSFGRVYRGELHGQPIAVKVIDVTNESQREKDLATKEINMISNLNHPNVIKYKGAKLTMEYGNHMLHMYLELCDGGDLHQAIQNQRALRQLYTEGRILYWFGDIAKAIQYLHYNNIIHRDIKPANILLHRGSIKLGDFGLAKLLKSRYDYNASRQGDPIYASPEVLFHNHCDRKSDMWSLGCTLYELTKLEPPFRTLNAIHMYGSNSFQLAPLPSGYSEVKQWINSLIQYNAARRPTADIVIQSIP